MKNLVIYEGVDKLGDSVLVKDVSSYDDFKKGLKVFSLPPYNEVLTDSEVRAEFDLYSNNGVIFGCYVNGNIAGINCILYDVPSDYSIGFYDKDKVAYYSGLAVLGDYRKRGLGKILVKTTQDFIEGLQKYDYSFARILCKGSMSEGIFKLNGFNDCYDNDSLIVDQVSYERNIDGSIGSDNRKYMVKTLNNKGKGFYRR